MGAETTYDPEGECGESKGNAQQVIRLETVFEADPHARCLYSSGNKRIQRGRYVGESGEAVPACAVIYESGATALFGTECANLGRCSLIGVGPQILSIVEAHVGNEVHPHPVIIEEDAGDSLAWVFEHGPGAANAEVLHSLGTPEREAENAKIAYDVFSQVLNAHGSDLYHCDLRCENVCVRRFGERPQDVRATIIDVDLGAGLCDGRPTRCASLYHALFREIPTHLVGGVVGTETEAVIVPTPLEMDLGYLAALLFHIGRGDLVLNGSDLAKETLDEFLLFLEKRVPFFGYAMDTMTLRIRRLDAELDVRPLAEWLGLCEVSEKNFPTEELLEQARTYHRLYLDGEDVRSFRKSPVARMHEVVDELVRIQFEHYKALRREQGRPVEYENLEDQPEDLQFSNYDQMAHVLTKVAALGYVTVDLDSPAAADRVREFSDEQVEILARMEHARWVKERTSRGWTLGEKKDDEAKTSPYLVPYDRLSDDIQEYDRSAARDVIPSLELAGVAVVRPA